MRGEREGAAMPDVELKISIPMKCVTSFVDNYMHVFNNGGDMIQSIYF